MAVKKFHPLNNPQLKTPPEYTRVVSVRKEGVNYVAHPQRIHVRPGRCANVVFVLENAPKNARLVRVILNEPRSGGGARSNPFSLPGKKRVMLLTDDNIKAAHQSRKFKYKLMVQEGKGPPIAVDPGIDNDPPG